MSTETIPVQVQLSQEYLDLFDGASECFDGLREWMDSICTPLGLSSIPIIEATEGSPGRSIRIRVHDVPQPISLDLISRAAGGTNENDVTMQQLARFLLNQIPRSAMLINPVSPFVDNKTLDQPGTFGDFLCRLIQELVMEHPECLVGASDVARFMQGRQLEAGTLSTEEASLFLRSVVAFGGAAADLDVLWKNIEEIKKAAGSIEDAIEAALPIVKPSHIGVLVHQDDVGSWQLASEELFTAGTLVEIVGEHLYSDLGVRLPRIDIRGTKSTPSGSFRVTRDWMAGPVVPCQPQERLSKLQSELSRRPQTFVTIETVEYELSMLNVLFPELVGAVLARLSLHDLTRVLRSLVSEGASIRDLRALLERMLQFATVPADPRDYLVLDYRLPVTKDSWAGVDSSSNRLLAFVRSGSGLRNYLSNRYCEGGVMPILLVEPEIEETARLAVSDPTETRERIERERQREALRDMVWAAVQKMGRVYPLLALSPAGRIALRQVLVPELPDVPVITRDEIRAGIRIQKMGRVGTGPSPRVMARRA